MSEAQVPETRTALARLGWTAQDESAFQEHAGRGYEPARVAVQHRNAYLLYTGTGETEGALAGRLRHRVAAGRDLPAVGDWVAIERKSGGGRAVIHATLPRRSLFVRKVAGREFAEQVLAANVDVAFVVVAANTEPNLRRVERYLTQVWDSGAAPVLVLTKIDITDDEARANALVSMALGVPVIATSAVTGVGLDGLRAHLRAGSTVALLGVSGAGKSTLINALIGQARQSVGDVRRDGKGRHTTTRRELIPTSEGAWLLDTPGLRELQLWAGEDEVQQVFDDIAVLAAGCRFRDCRHAAEPGCAVRQAVGAGELDAGRLVSFHKLAAEARYLDAQTDRMAALERKRLEKVGNRTVKSELRRKHR